MKKSLQTFWKDLDDKFCQRVEAFISSDAESGCRDSLSCSSRKVKLRLGDEVLLTVLCHHESTEVTLNHC